MTDQRTRKKERVFERFPLEFFIEITGKSQSGKTFSDRGAMRNVSGNGLSFSTVRADCYAVGQKVAIRVCLPGTDELDASMASDATVIWMQLADQHGGSEEDSTFIGIAMHGCMAFQTRSLAPSEDSDHHA